MKISRISVWQVTLPLSVPYRLSGGRLQFDELDSTFVRIDTDEGVCGWGEACPWGHTYLPAHGAGVRAGLELLAPALLGQDPRALDALNRRMDATLPGHAYAKSALDIACWDILGKAAGLPLWMLLGGDLADPVAINSSISTGTPEEMVTLIRQAREKGYRTHSAKIGGSDVTLDIARIDAISADLPEGEHVTYDVNRAWTPGTALMVLNSVISRDWVEQPCESVEACAHVARRVANPIMLDECLHSFQDHLNAWNLGACEGAKVKPNRLGGLTKARQVRDFGVSVGWQMHIEDVGGSALADTAAIHLASATPKANRLASWLCHDHLALDPVPQQGARNKGGFVVPPSQPGLGVEPVADLIGEPVAVYG
ncbi:mandelate racemase/muconate lactonizing enzyme family protein [Hoeflea prorocentri]|uniref:Mandelate racemase/muconate lactonizing enzyme family protein n=1 Tax=Hoeflea prorocentri TaxID=1922333 RepID=A0A9X3UQ95_9HYPH|nr:mandelate racemase/muconate lactonizing enzyme family protein [Hoeflea prorocentri]MCY6383211.1 mandelate racemase/muconate lactonizing enzyme family protein [Hoeflea prorocentri]MDA5401011.1 mandelate racemase/muconate lactonizing enzyme family protein [Hoeflea prorocentri]